jgi:hypothetical protein
MVLADVEFPILEPDEAMGLELMFLELNNLYHP